MNLIEQLQIQAMYSAQAEPVAVDGHGASKGGDATGDAAPVKQAGAGPRRGRPRKGT